MCSVGTLSAEIMKMMTDVNRFDSAKQDVLNTLCEWAGAQAGRITNWQMNPVQALENTYWASTDPETTARLVVENTYYQQRCIHLVDDFVNKTSLADSMSMLLGKKWDESEWHREFFVKMKWEDTVIGIVRNREQSRAWHVSMNFTGRSGRTMPKKLGRLLPLIVAGLNNHEHWRVKLQEATAWERVGEECMDRVLVLRAPQGRTMNATIVAASGGAIQILGLHTNSTHDPDIDSLLRMIAFRTPGEMPAWRAPDGRMYRVSVLESNREGLAPELVVRLDPCLHYHTPIQQFDCYLQKAKSLELTDREAMVLAYAAVGMSNKEIAHAIGTSPNTVRNQTVSLFGKLGVCSRIEAMNKLLQ